MTFEEFQASKVWYDDMRTWPSFQDCSDDDEACPGYVYLDALYIDRIPEANYAENGGFKTYYLHIIHNSWTSDNLEELERHLYQFAVEEGYEIDDTKP